MNAGSVAEVAAAVRSHQSFILTSHARPDGDAIGSELSLAFALDALGKNVRVVNHDPVPAPYRVFPGIDRIELADNIGPIGREGPAVIVLECGNLARTEVKGLDAAGIVINIDHHVGNSMYGAVNWFDESAAACAEMVAELIDALGVPWSPAIATHLYLGIVTDTGGFHHANITPRTFELCRRITETGVDAAAMARQIFDSYNIGRLKIMGALLDAMTLFADGRIAVQYFDDELLARCGATFDDTDSLVNVPLGARDVVASVLFKRQGPNEFRVSLRSKGAVDVRRVAAIWNGGGHVNAAGCTVTGAYEEIVERVVDEVAASIAIGESVRK